jgi:tRNA (mo5U34)-methyltransferase
MVPTILTDQWRAAARAHPGLAAHVQRYAASLARHGDAERWLGALEALPALRPSEVELDATVFVGRLADANAQQRLALTDLLMQLQPWRKGPWSLFGVAIDSEWRSDWKWARIAPHLEPLSGRRILDVGCGNGYYGWRMCAAGASSVLGVDPTVLFVMQHAAVSHYVAASDDSIALRNQLLPCRLEELGPTEPFDTLFAMGVLYHRRDPLVHLRELRQRLRAGGQLVLETLILDDPDLRVLVPEDRYARMRNVWQIPSPSSLIAWLVEAGFEQPRVVDVTVTSPSEQRATQWMRFESLIEALDPADPSHTVEGYPAPRRAVVLASA